MRGVGVQERRAGHRQIALLLEHVDRLVSDADLLFAQRVLHHHVTQKVAACRQQGAQQRQIDQSRTTTAAARISRFELAGGRELFSQKILLVRTHLDGGVRDGAAGVRDLHAGGRCDLGDGGPLATDCQ